MSDTMQWTEDFSQVLTKLMADDKYGAIEDRYERMHYLVTHHAQLLKTFGKRTVERCVKYELKHSKLINPSLVDQSSISRLFAWQLERTRQLFVLHSQAEDGLSLKQFSELMTTSNAALCYSQVNWNDWPCMLTLLQIYVSRAVVLSERGMSRSALSDLRHASSILTYTHPDALLEHFKHQDKDLLSTMASLKMKLIIELYNSNVAQVKEKLNGNNVENSNHSPTDQADETKSSLEARDILAMIRLLDGELENCEQKRSLLDTEMGKSFNYWLTDKAGLLMNASDGRSFVAQAAIAKNELILVERAHSIAMFQQYWFKKCHYCSFSMETFWPCMGCDEVGFCSAKCAQLAYAEFHKQECGIYGQIMRSDGIYSVAHAYRFYSRFDPVLALVCEEQEQNNNYWGYFSDPREYFNSEVQRTTPFRKQSLEERSLLCRTSTGLLSHRGHRSWSRECTMTVHALALAHIMMKKGLLSGEIVQEPEKYSRLLEHLACAIMRASTNGFCWAEEKVTQDGQREQHRVGSSQSLVAAFFNHSCVSNVYWFMGDGGIIRLVAARPIAPGEPLTLSYGPKLDQHFELRQDRLRLDYCFYCRCEGCMRDVANSSTGALRCQSQRGCRGPLVLRPFTACLECGYPETPSEMTFDVASLVQQAQQSSRAFMHIIRKLHQPKSSSPLAQFMPGMFVSRKKRANVGFNDLLHNTSNSIPLNVSKLTTERINKLEKHFLHFSAVIYGGSYSLLEKCALLLKVYDKAELAQRGLLLMGQLDQCLATIFPSLVTYGLVKVVYALDYAAHFYEKLVAKREHRIPEMIASVHGLKPLSYDPKLAYELFWSFYGRLNGKLTDILKYDLENRGDFFPYLHQLLKEPPNAEYPRSLDLDDELLPIYEAYLEPNEQFFLRLFYNCQGRRLALSSAIFAY